jgi:Sigma-70 region 2
MEPTALDATLSTLWRVESPRLIARLARLVGDLDTAEELAQDTFVAAIERWRSAGIPNNPAAWLNTTARFLAVDRIRRRDTHRHKYHQVADSTPRPPSWTSTGFSPVTRAERHIVKMTVPSRRELTRWPPPPVSLAACLAHLISAAAPRSPAAAPAPPSPRPRHSPSARARLVFARGDAALIG